MDIRKLKLLGVAEACELLDIKRNRLGILVKKYNIPHIETVGGKIFLREDLETFQNARAINLKHSRKR